MDNTIGDMLNDEVPELGETAPEAVAEPEGPARGPDGKFVAKETGVETPPQDDPVAEPVPPTEPANQLPQHEYAALKDERRKRQELENELRFLREQAQRAPQQPAAPTPDFWDDPAAFMQHMQGQMRENLLQSLRQEQQVDRLNASEQAAMGKYPDYSEAFAAFEQAVQYNPRLAQELARASDPGEFAYSKGKAALTLEQYGSIDAMLAAKRQEWEAEVRGAAPQFTQRLPSTTAADGTVGARRGPEWSGATPLGDILSK